MRGAIKLHERGAEVCEVLRCLPRFLCNNSLARGPKLVDVILESLDSWLDSEIPGLILVIPIY